MTRGQDVLELNRLEELTPFGPLWQALLERTPRAHPVRSLDYLRWYWSRFGNGRKLRVLLVPEDGEVTCLFPLSQVTDPGSRWRRVTWAVPELAPFFGPVGRLTVAATKAVLRHLKADARHWDVLELSDWWDGPPSPELAHSPGVSDKRPHDPVGRACLSAELANAAGTPLTGQPEPDPHPFDRAVQAVGLSAQRTLLLTGCQWLEPPGAVSADDRASAEPTPLAALPAPLGVEPTLLGPNPTPLGAKAHFSLAGSKTRFRPSDGEASSSETRCAPTAVVQWRVFSPGTLRGRWLQWQHRWAARLRWSRPAGSGNVGRARPATERLEPAGTAASSSQPLELEPAVGSPD